MLMTGAKYWVYAAVLALSTQLADVIPAVAKTARNLGTIVLVGGILRFDKRIVWERIIELAGGTGATFVVLPAATSRPRLYGAYAVRALQYYGAVAELLPLAPEASEFGVAYQQAVQDPALLAKIKHADGVFFTGGAPQNIAQTLYDTDGNETPLLAAIRQVYLAGGVITGANAGEFALSTDVSVLPALQAGLPDQAIQRGLGLLDKRWFVDQHAFSHGRFAASMLAMRSLDISYCIGVGINAAVVVSDTRHAEVIGTGGVLLIDLSQVPDEERRTPFRLTAAQFSYLTGGDRFDLGSLRITPHTYKLEGFEVDPNAIDYAPWYTGPSFHPDIFAPSALVDLIFSAIDGSARQGVGLAYAKNGAAEAIGFKFRLYPRADSFGWYHNRTGADDYTVANIGMDVRAVPNASLYRLADDYETGR